MSERPIAQDWQRELLVAILEKEIDPYLRPLRETLARIRQLLELSDILAKEPPDDTKTKAQAADILRSAVVLIHACFEDFLRTVANNLLPVTDENALREITLVGSPRGKSQFHLAHLFPHRNKTVEQLIRESVSEHLERSTFNNMTDVSQLLEKLHITFDNMKGLFGLLDQMMRRRHQIVHRADRVKNSNGNTYKLAEIHPPQVDEWLKATEEFINWIIAVLSADAVIKGLDAKGYMLTRRKD